MNRIKYVIKSNPLLMNILYRMAHSFMLFLGLVIPVNDKTIIFASFSGRNFDDSPRAIFEYLKKDPYFEKWTYYWAFTNPDQYTISGVKKIKFGTIKYWITLLSCKVWITNGGIDKGINYSDKKRIIVNTWHGTPMKRIEGEELNNKVLETYRKKRRTDITTIRCCQSNYDKDIFSRVFRADPNCFINCGLPRNDCLLNYSSDDLIKIKEKVGIPVGKKVILYMPTYREFLVNENNEHYLKPPIDLRKWESELSSEYCLLIRAHYAVTASLEMKDGSFAKDVSGYSPLTDLYAIANIMISDYSSSFFDYALLGRPMRCFAYDYEEYAKNRGFYFDLFEELPCQISHNEDELLDSIVEIDYDNDCKKTRAFAQKYIPYEGNACSAISNELKSRLDFKEQQR